MMERRTSWKGWILVALLTARLPAQEAETPERLLEKAEVARKTEQDLLAAEALYRKVLANEKTRPATRTRAWLLLGRCLHEEGRADEAIRAYEEAAKGEGKAAIEARAILSGRAAAEKKLAAQVTQLLNAMKGGPGASEAFDHLTKLRDAAVPHIARALESETEHAAIRRLARALLMIGSEKAAAYVEKVMRSDDRFLQQVFLSELGDFQPVEGRVRRAFLPLLETGGAQARAIAMNIVRSVLSRDELLRFIESEHRTSRDSALREVQSRGLLADPEVASRALAVVRKMIGSGDPEEREIVESVARARELKATRDGQLFLLEALWRGVVQDTRVLRQGVATQLTYSPRDFLRAAEEIEKIEDDSLAKRTRGLISALLDESIAFWSREDLVEIQVLLKKGFGSVSSEHWILELVEPEDVPWVASSLGHFRTKFENAVRWLDQQSLDREAVSALARWVEDSAFRESLLTTTWSRSKGRSRIFVSAAEILSRAIAAVAGAESDRVLERLVEVDSRHFFDPVTAAVVSSPVFHRDVCVRLLVRAADWPQHAEDLLRRLAVEGVYVPEVVEAVRRDFNRPEYLRLVVVGEDSGDRSAYDGKAQAAILDAALSGKTPKNWEHVRREIVERKLLAERGSASDEVVEVLFNRALDHPDAKGRGLLVMHLLGFPSSYNELKLSLRERILAGGSPNLLRVAASGSPIDPRDLDWLKPLLTHPDSGVVRAAVRRFREVRGKEYVEWLAPCLKNPDPQVRSTATPIVYELGGEDAVQRIVPLARDPDSEVRKTVCETLGRSLSPAAADVLIESLRDGDQRVSQAASKALSRIEKYFEHRRRWDRWKSEFSLEADSAAEALLRQAGGENPKKVRLAAIRSLGAVGVPETLPFLIRLMVDRDVDVSEAAAVAIEQIQRKLESAPPRPFGGLKK